MNDGIYSIWDELKELLEYPICRKEEQYVIDLMAVFAELHFLNSNMIANGKKYIEWFEIWKKGKTPPENLKRIWDQNYSLYVKSLPIFIGMYIRSLSVFRNKLAQIINIREKFSYKESDPCIVKKIKGKKVKLFDLFEQYSGKLLGNRNKIEHRRNIFLINIIYLFIEKEQQEGFDNKLVKEISNDMDNVENNFRRILNDFIPELKGYLNRYKSSFGEERSEVP